MSDELQYLADLAAKQKISRRAFLGRASALGASALFANSLLANSALAAGPIKGGILKAGMQGGAATDSLDPALAASQVPNFWNKTWGEQLVQLAPDGSLEPCLAEEWSASDGGKSWSFKIRSGVQFHNGKELTAEDVVATMERHSNEESQSGALGIMGDIESVTSNGDMVTFALKGANADLPYLLDDYHLVIQPNGGKDAPTAAIGTGPYKTVENQPGVRLVGEKYENYWRDDRGFADQIEVIVINDSTARTAALQGGQVDMINRVEPKIVALIKNLPGITIRSVSGKGHYVFCAQSNTDPYTSADLRLAMKYALNREDMVAKILQGYGTVGNDTPISSSYPLFTEIQQREFDLDKAAFHYKKSGNEGPIILHASDVAFPGALDAAQLFQQTAASAGIPLDIKREPGDGYWSDVWNKTPFFQSYWNGRPTQDQMYSTAYYSKAEWNETRFNNEKFDQMLVAARAELDQAKRRQMYADMGQLLHDKGGLLTPMFNDFINATNDSVGGWIDDGAQELMGGYALSKCWKIA